MYDDLPELDGALADPALYLGLVTAGATAPLSHSGFALGPLTQIARYNRRLFGESAAQDAPSATH